MYTSQIHLWAKGNPSRAVGYQLWIQCENNNYRFNVRQKYLKFGSSIKKKKKNNLEKVFQCMEEPHISRVKEGLQYNDFRLNHGQVSITNSSQLERFHTAASHSEYRDLLNRDRDNKSLKEVLILLYKIKNVIPDSVPVGKKKKKNRKQTGDRQQ